eukprot:TRINITY_DN2770_c0_g1_i1.p1 TRINITY_DN2770_c0_g1~~TRINITY_DN2770_c0_g1_i1.p1  ORF type:complete len:503 (-),score=139.23 TRINITY_DN2770_c0_g1_i1:42-1550(-)
MKNRVAPSPPKSISPLLPPIHENGQTNSSQEENPPLKSRGLLPLLLGIRTMINERNIDENSHSDSHNSTINSHTDTTIPLSQSPQLENNGVIHSNVKSTPRRIRIPPIDLSRTYSSLVGETVKLPPLPPKPSSASSVPSLNDKIRHSQDFDTDSEESEPNLPPVVDWRKTISSVGSFTERYPCKSAKKPKRTSLRCSIFSAGPQKTYYPPPLAPRGKGGLPFMTTEQLLTDLFRGMSMEGNYIGNSSDPFRCFDASACACSLYECVQIPPDLLSTYPSTNETDTESDSRSQNSSPLLRKMNCSPSEENRQTDSPFTKSHGSVPLIKSETESLLLHPINFDTFSLHDNSIAGSIIENDHSPDENEHDQSQGRNRTGYSSSESKPPGSSPSLQPLSSLLSIPSLASLPSKSISIRNSIGILSNHSEEKNSTLVKSLLLPPPSKIQSSLTYQEKISGFQSWQKEMDKRVEQMQLEGRKLLKKQQSLGGITSRHISSRLSKRKDEK